MRALGGAALLLIGSSAWPAALMAAEAPAVAVYAYPEDSAAVPIATKAAESVVHAAALKGVKAGVAPRVGELIEHSPDDLVRASESLANARASYAEGVDEAQKLRLDQAQEALLRARSALLEAGAAPAYRELESTHTELGVVALDLGQAGPAEQQFRTAAFLAPQRSSLDANTYPPSVVQAFAEARRSLLTGPRGGLRVESDYRGTTILLDGVSKGLAPKVLPDLPEGTHYLELRAPGASPQLMEVEVVPGVETPVVVNLRPSGPTLRQMWAEGRGDSGAAAIARILQAEKLVLIAVRSTVAGVDPFSYRAATFDAAMLSRVSSQETTLPREPTAQEEKLSRAAEALLRTRQKSVNPGQSLAAVYALREHFAGAGKSLLALETGAAFSNMIFDASGNYVSSSNFDSTNPYDPVEAYDNYTETRTVLHFRYGMRDRVTLEVDVPFLSKSVSFDYLDGNRTLHPMTATNSGMGDVAAGVEIRIPRWEAGSRTLVYLSTRVKLPTGESSTRDYLRRYNPPILGSGIWDLYAGLGSVWADGALRLEAELGYNFHVPGNTIGGFPQGSGASYVNLGDEQKLHLAGGIQVGRWLAPEVDLDFMHRDVTKGIPDGVTLDNNGNHPFEQAREMYLLTLGGQITAELSERALAGGGLQYPLWGEATSTLFPLDVTGPRLWVFVGRRF